MKNYTPKIILITGATGGIGKAFCKRFEAIGSKIIVHGRNEEKIKNLCEELDVDTYPLLFDIADREATLKALEAIPEEFKDIDLLINNAGGSLGQAPAHEAKLQDWENMIDMNVTSLTRITNIIIKGMVERKRGHIINIGSVAGSWPYPGGHVYCASKAYVRQFSLALRADLLGTNVRVTNIEPGMVETQFSLVRFKGDKEKADAVYANTEPLQAEDIAETAFWAACLPEHVNINTLEVMPAKQSLAGFSVDRDAG